MVFLNYVGNVFIPYPNNLTSGVSLITADFIAISYYGCYRYRIFNPE